MSYSSRLRETGVGIRIRATPSVVAWVAAFGIALMPTHQTLARPVVPCTEEAIPRGLNYIMQSWPFVSGSSGHGCGFADLDSDGDQDVIILGAGSGKVGLFQNNGNGHFTDRTINSGIPFLPEPSGFAAADYDGDGLNDIYLTQWSANNLLMRNLGNFKFSNVAATAGVDYDGPCKGCCWGDYDKDGWVDLYVTSYNCGVPNACAKNNKLYRNNGNGTFADVSVEQGVDDSGYGFEAVWFDMDRDDDLDLYLCNDRGHLSPFKKNRFWRNDNGHLIDAGPGSGADVACFAMGLGCGDFDGNGFPDIYITNIAGYPEGFNPLILNQGNGTFVESSLAADVQDWNASWGAIFFDFDNNGFLDLYVNNQFVANKLYLNSGTFPCSEVGVQAAVESIHRGNKVSYCSAVADVNGDGALDLLVNNSGGNVQLFINHEAQQRRHVRYRIIGADTNTAAVGANIDTRIGTAWQFRELYAGGSGFLGQNELIIHVGVGSALTVDEAVVKWPGGSPTRTLTNLPTNNTWTVYPPSRLGDFNNNGTVDEADFGFFAGCFGGTMQPGQEMMDFDGNSIINDPDFQAFLNVYSGALNDCDNDTQLDMYQILSNPGLDLNHNGVLDACECPPDIAPPAGNNIINIDDLLELINQWGPCVPQQACPADIAPPPGNGTVNIDDLLTLINAWGPCD